MRRFLFALCAGVLAGQLLARWSAPTPWVDPCRGYPPDQCRHSRMVGYPPEVFCVDDGSYGQLCVNRGADDQVEWDRLKANLRATEQALAAAQGVTCDLAVERSGP